MIDTSSSEFAVSFIQSFIPYPVMSILFTREELRREKFFETVEEYMDFVARIDQETAELNDEHQSANEVFVSVAIRILVLLAQKSYEEAFRDFHICEAFLDRIKSFSTGRLCVEIRKTKYMYGVVEPQQAPRGWTCSVCMSRSESHLCYKTKCGHFLHYGCYNAIESESCPLCRQNM
jgi:hypothetical protein